MTRVAVIPARGGSKRIPGKNIRPFHGRPMIAWPVAAVLASGCFDRVIVSTDDPAVAEIARECGVEAPFVRPPELSGDFVPTIPVIAHVIRWLRTQGCAPDSVCCVYATAAFLNAEDLLRGRDVLERTGCDYAFAVTSYAFPIQRAIRLTNEHAVEMLNPQQFNTRSQDLAPAYHDAAQFYWGRADAWLKGVPIFSSGARAVLLPRWRVADIDTPEDWAHAELMFEALRRTSMG